MSTYKEIVEKQNAAIIALNKKILELEKPSFEVFVYNLKERKIMRVTTRHGSNVFVFSLTGDEEILTKINEIKNARYIGQRDIIATYADRDFPSHYTKKDDYMFQLNISDVSYDKPVVLESHRLVLNKEERENLSSLMKKAYDNA